MSTLDGPAALAPVATALGRTRLEVSSVTVRTPHSRRRVPGADRVAPRGGAVPSVSATAAVAIRGREAGFLRDVRSVAAGPCARSHASRRRCCPPCSSPPSSTPSNLGALENLARGAPGFSYKAFLIPMAIAFAVTGMSRAPTLVTDIQGGYFDRLCMTPVRRTALLLGLMAADIVVIVALCLPVLAIGFAVGVRFATGAPGVLAFIALSALWGLAFTGLPYAVALKTGSPAAVNATFVVFFPLFFLSDAVVPKQALTGWFSHHRHLQPRHLCPGRPALAHHRRDGMPGPCWQGLAALAGIGIAEHDPRPPGAEGPDPTWYMGRRHQPRPSRRATHRPGWDACRLRARAHGVEGAGGRR